MTDNTNERFNEVILGKIREKFESHCIATLFSGYKLMKEAGEYRCAWEEEALTANLVKHMKLSPQSTDWKLDITPEYHLYTHEITDGIKKAKKSPRIDIRIMNWSYREKMEYFMEAKNLVENDWRKPDGSIVSASYLRARYIDTGIDNFVTKRYPRGCLAGYALEGSVDNIVEGINRMLESNRRNRPKEILKRDEPVHNHPHCFKSEHPVENSSFMVLRHFFLNFN